MADDLEEYKSEILETLDSAEEALLAFDNLPENESSANLYDKVFRAYHNIKGAAGMLEWNELQHHIHQLENVLMQSKETLLIPKAHISWLLKGNDVARQILAGESYQFNYDITGGVDSSSEIKTENVEAHNQTRSDVINDELIAEVTEAMDRIQSALIQIESGAGSKELIDAVYRDTHSVKGSVDLFGLKEASTLAHAMESSLEPYRNQDTIEIDISLSGTLLLCVDLMLQCVRDPGNKEISKEVDFMLNLLGSSSRPSKSIEVSPVNQEEKIPQTFSKEVKVEKNCAISSSESRQNHEEKSDSTIRVQVSLLDRMMTLMGEMVLVRNQVLQYSNKCEDLEFLNLSQKLDVVTSELQEETMKTRMQPIGNILSKFQRVVRDLSSSLGKKIVLNLKGVETELDKSLIEAVKDPLTHIVRNACDHGIESPQDRLDAGKNESGTITIQAYHQGGQVIVDIQDDGKGLSRSKLIDKAIQKGLITKERAQEMSDREVQALIFAPGFSTAEKVTNVSGRGVGMDVVKSNIEKIGGQVEISSVHGEGTKITLKIPLTLAIVPALIVKALNDRYAIAQVKLVELIRVEPSSVEYVQGKPVYRLRGNILPLVDLREVFCGPGKNFETNESINIVVLNSHNTLFGLIVDEIMDTADIVVKPLARFLKPLSIYSGATVLGDGSVAFILDIVGIAQKHLGSGPSLDESQQTEIEMDHNEEAKLNEYVLVGLATQTKHAIALESVGRMEEIPVGSFEYSGHQRVIRYRGGVLKIISLNEVLGYTSKHDGGKEIAQIIVVKVEDQLYGIEVDQIIDVLKTSAYLDDSLDSHPAITGNLVTEDEIIVVVDMTKVIESIQPKKFISHTDIFSQGKRILLVEDTESIRNKVADIITNMGHTVEVALDGIDALKKIAENKGTFDLIISDIEMPRMNGHEFTRRIRSIERFSRLPIIAFTTRNSDLDVKEAKAAGFTTYLEKSKFKLLPLLINECLNENKRKAA
jgi:two-component system, chemotaxis family, sensor kinase CheA